MNTMEKFDYFTEKSLESLWEILVKESIDASIFTQAPDPSILPIPLTLM